MATAPREWTIGVDVGGTKVAAGAVDLAGGAVVHRREIATRAERGSAAVLDDIASLVEAVAADLRRDGRIAQGVGIGVPELVDAQGQIRSSYLLDWAARSLAERLTAIGPVRFESDVRAAAAAEARLGAGRPYRLFVYVSVGTGISSTLVQEGVPLSGARGGAVVLSTAPISVPCDACGAWSEFVLEDFSSGQALARRYREASGREVENAQQVVLAAANGDHHANAVVESAGRALGSAVAWLVNVLDPEAVIVGGGLGLAGSLFWDCLTRATRSHIWNEEARGLPIIPAALGADAGLIGAALTTSCRSLVTTTR
jgi:glucokinase